MDKSELDELRAGWEVVREKVKALQLTAQFYAERNQQLIDENRAMRDAMAVSARDHLEALDAVRAKDELLWWVTASIGRHNNPDCSIASWSTAWDVAEDTRQMLATQGYTRESLENK